MPFSTVYSKIKTFGNGGKIYPADLNDAFDDIGDQVASINVAGGFNEGANVRRGKCIVATEESRSNVAYGLLTTPDRVQNVVLPADGLIIIRYEATWKESVNDAALAAIFIGATQLKYMDGIATISPQAQETDTDYGGTNTFLLMGTFSLGLKSAGQGSYPGTATTGQNFGLGGPVEVTAAAGTYDISVQFKASSGSVTVKNRRLLVETYG